MEWNHILEKYLKQIGMIIWKGWGGISGCLELRIDG